MSDLLSSQRENAELRARNLALERRVSDTEAALAAVARGEVDAVAIAASASPILLHAAQARLRSSQQLLRAVFDSSTDAIMLADDHGVYIDANPAALSLLALARDEVIGQRFTAFVVTEADSEAGLKHFLPHGSLAGQLTIRRSDGTLRIVDYSAVANVTPGVHLSVLRDVTERERAEEALRASRDQLEEAQAIAHVGSWTSDVSPDGKVEWSSECYRIYGIPDGTPMTVAAFFAHVHPDDRERMHLTTRAALDQGAPAEIEHRIVRCDGQVRRVQQRGVVERDATGLAIRMFGTLQDVTDRVAALEAVRESEQRYRRIVENTTEGVWMYDADGITTFVNGRMAEMLGWTVAEITGRSMFELMKEPSRTAARERSQRRELGVSERSDFHLLRKDGTALWVSIHTTPLFDGEGQFEAALSLVTDVSAQRGADEIRAHLAAIVESSEDAITSATLEGTITSWNRGAADLYLYPAVEMIGTSMHRLIPRDALDAERTILGRADRGESIRQYECVRLRKDGTLIDVAVTLSPVRGGDGKVIGVSSIARDLTPRRTAEAAHRATEEKLRHAQKMEAVGRLAGGVAHDFNNLLTVVLSYSEFAIEDLKPGDPLREDMIQIKQAAMRGTDLTRQLLAFSRQQVRQPHVINLHQIVDGMRVMLKRLLGEDVELQLDARTVSGRVLADPGQIEQVVMNLAVNARDAMPDGGNVTIGISDVHVDAAYLGGGSGVPVGDYVLLSVRDTGGGMDAATRSRIFEPFFTTKDAGKGTGLGLSTVFGIVQQSGGHLRVLSERGAGSTFEAYFPQTDRIEAEISPSRQLPVIGGGETILLVEDEDQVRAVACAILRRSGYHVIDTANGGEAFLISGDYVGRIHLLLTDVVMPRMSGRRLAEELAPLRPEMKVLFASGYTDDAIVHHGVLEKGVAFLQKPFTPSTLLQRVREVLDAPAQPRFDHPAAAIS